MTLDENFSLSPNKKQELRVWLLRQPRKPGEKRLTLQALADGLKISLSTLSSHLENETMPTKHHSKLVGDFNIPADLLPEPKDLPPGPRPKVLASAMHQ